MQECLQCTGLMLRLLRRGVPIDNAKMILPEDIAQAALLPFQMSANACPTEIVINNTEPLKKPQS